MTRARTHFLFLNIGHFLDHLFTLIFATVAALALTREWGLSYAELVPYATPGFVAFGLFSLPAGWLSDRWSRYGMMSVFFVGIGIASIFTAFATTPLQIMILLFFVGILAESAKASGTGQAIAINGVWGNLGVGSAALITGFLIDNGGWRAAFVLPGLVSIAIGVAYFLFSRPDMAAEQAAKAAKRAAGPAAKPAATGTTHSDQRLRQLLLRLSIIIFCTAALSSIVFQSTTFALPKVLDERLGGIAGSATAVGWLAFVVFAIASMAQLVVGRLLDTLGPRIVFMVVAAMQVFFFLLMPGLKDWTALAVALGFMLGAFGQIPINDYMIGRMARSEFRGAVYGARYVVSFVALAAALPLIAWVHGNWGFDALFRILAATAAVIFLFVSMIPGTLPMPDEAPAKA